MAKWETERTRAQDVRGMIRTVNCSQTTMITCRVTKDKHGESMSLADEQLGIMLLIPLEPVHDMLRVVGG